MSMFYGDHVLDIDDREIDLLLTGLYSLALFQSDANLSGLSLNTLDETKHRLDSGFVLMGNVDKTALTGVGYIAGADGRVWFFIDEGKPKLFIDGPGDIVKHLGLDFDPDKKNVYSQYNDLVLLTL